MQNKNLMTLADCLALWAQQSACDFPRSKEHQHQRVKLGRTHEGNLLCVPYTQEGDDILIQKVLKLD